MTSRREGRSVSLGRHRDRQARDHSRGPIDEEPSTRQNVSNFMLTLQRVQAAEDENRQLRKENQILRQRARSSRLSSASFSSGSGGGGTMKGTNRALSPNRLVADNDYRTGTIGEANSDSEDKVIEENVKRNSLIFVGDAPVFPQTPEHLALEAQYKKLQADFDTLKDFVKHLFHHALTMQGHPHPSSQHGKQSTSFLSKDTHTKDNDVNTYNPIFSKQLEHSLDDIHGEITQLRNSQDQQQLRMEQVQMALDNVLSQSSVRNDVTMRIVRQQDKMKDLQKHVDYFEGHLIEINKSLRQAEEKLSRMSQVQKNLYYYISSNSRNLKGTARTDLNRYTEQLSQLRHVPSRCHSKLVAVNKMLSHISSASSQGQTLLDSKPPFEVLETISKLERLIGSDWHRFGRMLGLTVDCLDDIGKFTNFDLSTRVEKVISTWSRMQNAADGEMLKQACTKMDRDISLLNESPVSKDVCPVPPDVMAFFIAHVVDVSSITHTLAWQGILSQDTVSFILGFPEEYKRASRLIHSVVFMGQSALKALCHVLDCSNQTLVAFKLKGCLTCSPEDHAWESRSTATLIQKSTKTNNSSVSSSTPKQTIHQKDTGLLDPSQSSSSSSSSHRPKSREKAKTKRSRSLFTRKNKLRDSDTNVVDQQDINNTQDSYYPVTVV